MDGALKGLCCGTSPRKGLPAASDAPEGGRGYAELATFETEQKANGSQAARSCTPLRCALGLTCVLVVLILAWLIIGMVTGYSWVKLCYFPLGGIDAVLSAVHLVCQNGQIFPQLSKCDAPFCALGEGPLYAPGNVTGSLPVWAPECTSQALLHAVEADGHLMKFKTLQFKSRPGKEGQQQVLLDALWLPADGDGDGPAAPRVVLQHGNNVDFNDNSVLVPAYFLRSMGFSVLLPNFRYHGVTAERRAGQSIRWGYDIFLDTLGAWDYAVADPDGHLGGKLLPEKVGLMGVSMGGFAAIIAFGLEQAAPALWYDSGVFDARAEMDHQLSSAALGLFGIPVPLLMLPAQPLAWRFASVFAGADVGLHSPAQALAREGKPAGKARPLALMHGMLDTMVPVSQTLSLLDFLEKHSDHYTVAKMRIVEYSCGGEQFPFPNHCQMSTWQPNVYRRDLCEFWSKVFSQPVESCGIADLPVFPECTEAVCPKPPGP